MRNTELDALIDERTEDLRKQIAGLESRLPPIAPPEEPAPTYARSRRFSYEVGRISNGHCTPSFLEAPQGAAQVVSFVREKAAYANLPIQFVPWTVDHRTLTGEDRFLLVEQLWAAGRLDKNERVIRDWHFTGPAPIPDRTDLKEL
jgi:hypothetical protein